MKPSWAFILALLAVPASAETLALLPSSAVAGPENVPTGWEPLTFKKIKSHTQYEWSAQEHAVHAVSSAAASGLIYRLDHDPAKFPILRWRWRVTRAIPGGDEKSKRGDDFASRVYVTFRYAPSKAGTATRIKYGLVKTLYGDYPPHAGINYIWANRLVRGESAANAYTDRVMMVAVRSGDAEAGEWIAEERNILEDYRRLFNQEPPPLAGVAIMTDTDDTRSQAEAWYADIELRSAP